MKIYIIDDTSINKSWTANLEREAKYVVLHTSDELQHITEEDQRKLMSEGIKSVFIRCTTIEDIYAQLGYLAGKYQGNDIVLVSDSQEYDNLVIGWKGDGLSIRRESVA